MKSSPSQLDGQSDCRASGVHELFTNAWATSYDDSGAAAAMHDLACSTMSGTHTDTQSVAHMPSAISMIVADAFPMLAAAAPIAAPIAMESTALMLVEELSSAAVVANGGGGGASDGGGGDGGGGANDGGGGGDATPMHSWSRRPS